jgi:hypothetical protein
MTYRANAFCATTTQRPKYGARKQLTHSFLSWVRRWEERSPAWCCHGDVPVVEGACHQARVAIAWRKPKQMRCELHHACRLPCHELCHTPRACPATLLFYFFSSSRRRTERAAPCCCLRAEIHRLPPRSRPSASSPSGSLRISIPTSSTSSPVDHEVTWPKLGEDAARWRELVEDDRRWREDAPRPSAAPFLPPASAVAAAGRSSHPIVR